MLASAAFCSAPAQKLPPNAELYNYYIQEVKLLNLHEGDTLVDIGAGTAEINAMYAVMINHLHQELVDIDEKELNAKNVKSSFKKILKQFHSKNIFSYNIHINTPRTIELPANHYPKVLCRRCFHEFVFPQPMLKEIHRILADTGQVIAMEPDFKNTNTRGPNCNRPYLSADSVIRQFRKSGFVLANQSSITMPFDHNNRFYILYFKKRKIAIEDELSPFDQMSQ